MRGMPSHFLPSLTNYRYPSELEHYHNLDCGIHDQYFNNYLDRVCLQGIDNSATSWYRDTFREEFPSTFTIDNKSGVTLSPSDCRRWLVFIHISVAMRLYLARYLIVKGDRVRLFGDGSAGVTLDLNGASIHVSGVDVPLDHTIGMVADDVLSL